MPTKQINVITANDCLHEFEHFQLVACINIARINIVRCNCIVRQGTCHSNIDNERMRTARKRTKEKTQQHLEITAKQSETMY